MHVKKQGKENISGGMTSCPPPPTENETEPLQNNAWSMVSKLARGLNHKKRNIASIDAN